MYKVEPLTVTIMPFDCEEVCCLIEKAQSDMIYSRYGFVQEMLVLSYRCWEPEHKETFDDFAVLVRAMAALEQKPVPTEKDVFKVLKEMFEGSDVPVATL